MHSRMPIISHSHCPHDLARQMWQPDKSSLEDHAPKPTDIHLRPEPKTSTNKHDVIWLSVASRILVV